MIDYTDQRRWTLKESKGSDAYRCHINGKLVNAGGIPERESRPAYCFNSLGERMSKENKETSFPPRLNVALKHGHYWAACEVGHELFIPADTDYGATQYLSVQEHTHELEALRTQLAVALDESPVKDLRYQLATKAREIDALKAQLALARIEEMK